VVSRDGGVLECVRNGPAWKTDCIRGVEFSGIGCILDCNRLLSLATGIRGVGKGTPWYGTVRDTDRRIRGVDLNEPREWVPMACHLMQQ